MIPLPLDKKPRVTGCVKEPPRPFTLSAELSTTPTLFPPPSPSLSSHLTAPFVQKALISFHSALSLHGLLALLGGLPPPPRPAPTPAPPSPPLPPTLALCSPPHPLSLQPHQTPSCPLGLMHRSSHHSGSPPLPSCPGSSLMFKRDSPVVCVDTRAETMTILFSASQHTAYHSWPNADHLRYLLISSLVD